MGNQLFELATLIVGLAMISMLVQRAPQAVQLAQGTSTAFGNLLQAATNQSSAPITSYNRRFGR